MVAAFMGSLKSAVIIPLRRTFIARSKGEVLWTVGVVGCALEPAPMDDATVTEDEVPMLPDAREVEPP